MEDNLKKKMEDKLKKFKKFKWKTTSKKMEDGKSGKILTWL